MKNKIFIPITFSRLWKNEFRDLVNLVVEFLIQYNPVTMDLKFVYDMLVTAQAALLQLHVPYGANPKTEVLKDKRQKRSKLVRAIVAQIRVLKQANAVVNIPHLDVLAPFVDRYLSPVIYSNSSTLTDVLKEMFFALDADTSVQDAITNLNLQSRFDELKTLQNGFTQTFIQRSNIKAERNDVVTLEVRANAKMALTKLLNEIELMQMKHPELDYNPLIKNLNDTFTFYMSQIRTRSTTNQKQIAAKSKVSTINTTTAQNGNSEAVAS